MTGKLFAENEAEALEQLHAQGLTDGLPVVIPTDEDGAGDRSSRRADAG